MNIVLPVASITLFIALISVAVMADEREAAIAAFSADSLTMDEDHNPLFASTVEIPVRGGTATAPEVHFPNSEIDKGRAWTQMQFAGGASVLLDDAELHFSEALFEPVSSMFIFEADQELVAIGGVGQRTSVTWTCRNGYLLANGNSTLLTSACWGPGVRLWCRGDGLRVETFSHHCEEP